jgi:dGTPase
MPLETQPIRVVSADSARDRRLHSDEGLSSATDPRSAARHDRDRIYYSTAFRRLAGVTQVFTPTTEGFLTHNRLTHSLKVAQVARAIAELLLQRLDDGPAAIERLGGLDADVVEAAGLAHDLGHPPFGHIGESVLDEYAREELSLSEGFEGNAQTFRIVARLEPRSRRDTGLDLTSATRAAILKYPWMRGDNPGEDTSDREAILHWEKFGAYAEERAAFDSALACVPLQENVQSLEAAIMDVADDITYALHDLEDFYGARLLELTSARDTLDLWRKTFAGREPGESGPLIENPFESLRAKLARDYPKRFSPDRYDDAAGAVEQHLIMLQQESVGTRRAEANSGRFVSQVITDFLGGVVLHPAANPDLPPLQLSPAHWHIVQLLKEITRQFVIQRPGFAVIQRGQQVLLKELLDALVAWCSHPKDKHRLPGWLREGFSSYGVRAIIDFVAGLSDHQAASLHRSLTGQGPQSLATTFMP